jgi:hypothetical protein
VLSQLRKDLWQVRNQISGLSRLDHDVVDVRLDDASYQFPENMSHASLECGTRILEPEGHCLVEVCAELNDE